MKFLALASGSFLFVATAAQAMPTCGTNPLACLVVAPSAFDRRGRPGRARGGRGAVRHDALEAVAAVLSRSRTTARLNLKLRQHP